MTDRTIQGRHYATGDWIEIQSTDGTITSIRSCTRPDNVSPVWIAPALVDLQVNGYGGIDFQQDNLTASELLSAAHALRDAGCTRWLLALITDDWSKLLARLRHLKQLRDRSPELRHAIAGWHIEGPFLSAEPGFCGAHDPSLMCDPSAEDIRALREVAGPDPLLITIAPERNGALEAIVLATSLGIKVSLGHTNASPNVLRDAVGCGATSFTHVANGCPRELDRHDNILWRVLDQRDLMVSIIPDGIHVSPTLFRLIHRLKSSDAIFYTADAMSAAGAGPGRYRIGRLEVEVGTDQIVRQPGKTNFAGSALRPVEGVWRAASMLRVPWHETWRHFSETPARFIGLGSGFEVGQPADLCRLEVSESGALQRLTIG